jgi:hypothetical protein
LSSTPLSSAAHATGVLPVDTSATADHLVGPSGEPVWPAACREDLEALTCLADVFSAPIHHVQGRVGSSERSTDDVVVALGDGVESAAELYAHLTQRAVRYARDLESLRDVRARGVVVTTPEWIDERLLDELYGDVRQESAPGVIWADHPRGLRQQVLRRSAACVFTGPRQQAWIDFSPIQGARWDVDPARELLTLADSPARVREGLAAGAGVLHICTHSDGIDADFGSDLVLCPFDAYSAAFDDRRSPRCWATRFCHRRAQPVAVARSSGALLSPSALRARILVWNVCLGLLHPRGIVGTEWGMTARLIDESILGAVITPLGIVLTNPGVAQALCRDLIGGVPAGAAVARFNRSAAARRIGLRMCLIGEPRLRLQTTPPPAPPRRPRIAVRSSFGTAGEADGSGFLRLFFDHILSYEVDPLASLATAARKAIGEYDQAVAALGDAEAEKGAGPRLRDAALRFLLSPQYSSDDGSWLPLARAIQTEARPRHCPFCRRRAVSILTALGITGASPRRLLVCARCGLVEDAPIRSTASFTIDGSIVTLAADRSPQSAAGLALRSKHHPDTRGWDWPRRPDGGLAERFEIPGPWPIGPMDIYLYHLHGASLAVLSTEARGPAAVPPTVSGEPPPAYRT